MTIAWSSRTKIGDIYGLGPNTSSIVITFTGPRFSPRMPGSIVFRSPTTTTANLPGWMYFCATRCDVGGGDRLDVLHVLGEVVVGQPVDEHVLEPARDVAGGLEAAREAQRDVVLRARQFVGRHRLLDAVQLVEELLQRLGGLVGLHAGGGEERPGLGAHVERRAAP